MKPPLLKIYRLMFDRLGPQHWWPGETPFEVMVGAVLTQNTNWGNVEKAIANLKRARMLNPRRIAEAPLGRLASLIRPSGYFRVKARRLRSYVRYFVARYGGSVRKMARQPLPELRQELLDVHGVGPETADSILLYALDKPIFVVDAYTRRIFARHGWAGPKADYAQLQSIFAGGLPAEIRLFNEYHALIVRVGKEYCRSRPRCEACPLAPLLPIPSLVDRDVRELGRPEGRSGAR
ncbi:MAG: endonuclease III domain-containing protein [Nitrospirae bacterium]|nr:endonuclease III domain-containing protein [Nitrospirota bacterium]